MHLALEFERGDAVAAKKRLTDQPERENHWDSQSFSPFRKSRAQIVDEAITALRRDLREGAKLKLDA